MCPVVLIADFVRGLFKVRAALSLALELFIASEKITSRLCPVLDELLELFLVLMYELLRERAIHQEVLHVSLGQFYFAGDFAVTVRDIDLPTNYWQDCLRVVIPKDTARPEFLSLKLDRLIVGESAQRILDWRGVVCSCSPKVFSLDRYCMISQAACAQNWFRVAQYLPMLRVPDVYVPVDFICSL